VDGWLVGLLIGWLRGWWVDWLFHCMVGWLSGWLVGWLMFHCQFLGSWFIAQIDFLYLFHQMGVRMNWEQILHFSVQSSILLWGQQYFICSRVFGSFLDVIMWVFLMLYAMQMDGPSC